MSTKIECSCGFSADTLSAVMDHQDAAHPERRAARREALQGLRQALSQPKSDAKQGD